MNRTPLLLLVTMAVTAVLFSAGGPVHAQGPVERARDALLEKRAHLGLQPDLADLTLVDVREGAAGEYVRFDQTIGGISLLGARVTVALSEDDARIVQSTYAPGIAPNAMPYQVGRSAAIGLALAELGGPKKALRGDVTAERVYVDRPDGVTLAWQVTLPLSDPLGTWVVAVAADSGDVLYTLNALRFDSGQVFDPNPPQSSGGTIPPPLDCDSAPNEVTLSSEYVSRELQGIDAGQHKLTGEYVDLTAPGIVGYKPAGQADEPSRDYMYPCTDDRFEEVMAYYHIDSTQRKLQSLGFSGQAAVVNRPIGVHAHYLEFCNAFYDFANQSLHFGDGGCGFDADAAEDADVIVHEYGHAIQDDQVPGWGIGLPLEAEQAWSMGEGFADFLTAAMFGDSCLGDWFSFGSACLREMENTAVYPADFEACRDGPGLPAEEHCGGLIWGGALWDLAQALGGDQHAFDLALTLVVESHFMLSPVATFDEAASAIRLADVMLFGGAHAIGIDSVFAARGISTETGVSDFSYAYLVINHPRRGHLDVDLLVGSQTAPVCALGLYGPVPGDNFANLAGYAVLDETPCEPNLPPDDAEPWYLRVRDVTNGFTGSIGRFEIVLGGSERCAATDLPIAIPDGGAFVYSEVDCSTKYTGEVSDEDGDGFNAATELHVGTDPYQNCGGGGWPADLYATGLSANTLDVQDIVSYLVPVRRLDTSPGDAGYDRRWDIRPGTVFFSDAINAQDLIELITLHPPMFGGERAYGLTCA